MFMILKIICDKDFFTKTKPKQRGVKPNKKIVLG